MGELIGEAKMSFDDALKKLENERNLTTAMLKPLGIKMDTFLQFSQLSDKKRAELIVKLIKSYKK